MGKYLLASLYETGSGVNQDRVEAYKWYLLSFTKRLPDELQAHAAAMTADQIAEAEQRAAAFVPEMEPAPPVEPSTRRVPIISVFSVVVLLCYTFLTVQIAYNLNLLERHETADYIPSLVYSIYLNHGYWPAVLATPCLGAALFGLYFWGLPFIGRVCGRWRP